MSFPSKFLSSSSSSSSCYFSFLAPNISHKNLYSLSLQSIHTSEKMATNKKPSKESKLKKILKVPLKILTSARDFYMKGMTEYSDQVYVMSNPTGNLNNMPRSYSVSSSKSNHFDDDYRELIRAASTRSTLGRSNNMDVRARQQYITRDKKSAAEVADNMSRSRSVAIGRIDEETSTCDFDEDQDVKAKTGHVYPRSRSHAVSKRTPTRAF